MSRSQMFGLFPSSFVGLTSVDQLDPSLTKSTTLGSLAKTSVYHKPPHISVDYSKNPTVFGRILQGELPASVLRESQDLLAFVDRTPRAPLHALIIPKQFIQDVYYLTATTKDIKLLEDMEEMALDILREHDPEAVETNDYRLVFHIPPFNSVDHLHVHVLAPNSNMKPYYKSIKYAENTKWSVSLDRVLTRLRQGKSAVSMWE
ncbi:hypothetical protein MPSEU_000007900 [Mayamaea pseudoterrestris]|nr:hypothetical protein MPSEU_000007900 [Mayamaea pseudoterrestris]